MRTKKLTTPPQAAGYKIGVQPIHSPQAAGNNTPIIGLPLLGGKVPLPYLGVAMRPEHNLSRGKPLSPKSEFLSLPYVHCSFREAYSKLIGLSNRDENTYSYILTFSPGGIVLQLLPLSRVLSLLPFRTFSYCLIGMTITGPIFIKHAGPIIIKTAHSLFHVQWR